MYAILATWTRSGVQSKACSCRPAVSEHSTVFQNAWAMDAAHGQQQEALCRCFSEPPALLHGQGLLCNPAGLVSSPAGGRHVGHIPSLHLCRSVAQACSNLQQTWRHRAARDSSWSGHGFSPCVIHAYGAKLGSLCIAI